jgi:hypothetical protein
MHAANLRAILALVFAGAMALAGYGAVRQTVALRAELALAHSQQACEALNLQVQACDRAE